MEENIIKELAKCLFFGGKIRNSIKSNNYIEIVQLRDEFMNYINSLQTLIPSNKYNFRTIYNLNFTKLKSVSGINEHIFEVFMYNLNKILDDLNDSEKRVYLFEKTKLEIDKHEKKIEEEGEIIKNIEKDVPLQKINLEEIIINEEGKNDDNYFKFFKLLRFKICNFKNIEDLEIDFSHNNRETILIGNNGCGKSNILEALSSIFMSLYKNNKYSPEFDYSLSYKKDFNTINIDYYKKKYHITVDDILINKSVLSLNNYLPSNIIACYSGNNLRLWNKYYSPYYNDYVRSIITNKIPELNLMYINNDCLELCILSLFFCDFSNNIDIAEFCNDTLNIQNIHNIKINFDIPKFKNWQSNDVSKMFLTINSIYEKEINISMDSLKTLLVDYNSKDIFNYFYVASISDNRIISKIQVDLKLNNGIIIDFQSLSEGEHRNILIRTILEVIGNENSLLLFDEPDSHIHVTRKLELKEVFDKFKNRENIITTHSPTLAMCFDIKNIESLTKDKNGKVIKIENKKHEIISELTGGQWSLQEENVFLSSNKKLTLLVEGKTDKIHLINAFNAYKMDYPNLDFDVYSMNSEQFVRNTLMGLSNSEIKWNKKFVGIFDNDNAGRDAIKNGFSNKENKLIYCTHNNVECKSFYAILLPKLNFNGDVTIENMYDSSKYEEAYIKAVNQKKGYFNGLSLSKINEDITNKSKTILADMSSSFSKEDFGGFKPLFDIINEINEIPIQS